MRRFWGSLIGLALTCGLAVSAFGQATPEPLSPEQAKLLDALKEQAIVISVLTRQKTAAGKISWKSDYSKLTVQGRPVQARFEGNNGLIVVQMTPYHQGDNLVLLVQTQVSIRANDQLQYYTNLMSVPAKFGESLFFYPLGQPDASKPDDSVIELEVILKPYQPPTTNQNANGAKP